MNSLENPSHRHEASAADSLWKQIEVDARRTLKELADKDPGHPAYFENAVEREKNFLRVVFEAIEKALKTSTNVAVLFDVDETLASHKYSREFPQGKTILRPVAIPLLQTLQKQGLKIGLFTSRGNPVEQLELQDWLGALKPFLTPALVISTRRHYPGGDSGEFADNLARDYGGEKGVVDAALIGNDPPSTTGDMSKLACLKALRKDMPEHVVIVDDADYPRVLNEKSGLYGVALREQNAMFLAPL